MPEEIDFSKLVKEISESEIDNWILHRGNSMDYYETTLGNKFGVSLIVQDNKKYSLAISQRSISDQIILSNEEVKNLYTLIEDRYNKKPKVIKENNREMLIHNLNVFLNNKNKK